VPIATTAERNRFAQTLFAPLPARYDRLAELLSFGQNGRWRRAMVDQIVPSHGRSVLDVASGTAGVAIQLARRTTAEVVGVDLTEQMLRRGRQNVAAAGLTGRIALVTGRAEQLPFPDASFDALTFTYLLRYVDDPAATLRELARVVKPGGRIATLEFGEPGHEPWHAMWSAYTRIGLPLLGRAVSREWAEVGRFLARSIPAFYARHPLDSLVASWESAGIRAVEVRVMSFGAGVVMWGTRDGAHRSAG